MRNVIFLMALSATITVTAARAQARDQIEPSVDTRRSVVPLQLSELPGSSPTISAEPISTGPVSSNTGEAQARWFADEHFTLWLPTTLLLAGGAIVEFSAEPPKHSRGAIATPSMTHSRVHSAQTRTPREMLPTRQATLSCTPQLAEHYSKLRFQTGIFLPNKNSRLR